MGSVASVAELPGWARTLLQSTSVAHLGLLDDDGAPRVLPVTYAVSAGIFVTAVDHKRKAVAGSALARVRWLRARPRAALTVDRYDDDWTRLLWVQALGSVEIADASDVPELVSALVDRYEQYRQRAPRGPVISLRPDRLLWWQA